MNNILKNYIRIKNANENNLKNVTIDIPKNKLIVITGVSGSGKSSLAFDVIYSEGRRRYVDSLSNYARQILGGTTKPDVESIEGLSPSIAVDQKTTSNNPRSTVGTITEIYDFYRLLFSKIGKAYCPNHNIEITSQTTTKIVSSIFEMEENTNIQILSPIIISNKGTHQQLLENLKKEGFVRVLIDGDVRRLDEVILLDKNKFHNISILIDRVSINEENRGRIFEAIEIASNHSDGIIEINNLNQKNSKIYSKNHSCIHGDFSVGKIEPRLFSFNLPQGACEKCKGLGTIEEVTWENLVNPELTILEGGILYFGTKFSGVDWQKFEALLKHYQVPIDKKLSKFTKNEKNLIMNGTEEILTFDLITSTTKYVKKESIEGLAKKIWRRYEASSSEWSKEWARKFLGKSQCDVCKGKRLNKEALSIKINDLDISEFVDMSVNEASIWIKNINLNAEEKEISIMIISEIINRLNFLKNVGLGYLTLSRLASTLSGGESQRIRLASQLGTKLTGVVYVLDEPSIGLHQSDNSKLIQTLKDIRDLGNTVIVVEHDEETMMEADYIIDIGPYAGLLGGEIVSFGTPEEVSKDENSLTGKYLSGLNFIDIPKERRIGNGKTIQIIGAKENNLKNISVTFNLGAFTVVTGVSGSGKSTLINNILYNGLYNKISNPINKLKVGKHDSIENWGNIDKVINVSQDPIGRTPRSNPATYTGLFDYIRDIFAASPESKIRGFDKGRFSFNTDGGRCEKCSGDGSIKIAMHFLPDVTVICDQCDGKRYNDETLQVKYKGKSIYDILEMSVDEAIVFFENVPKLKSSLQTLIDVGMGYIKLGHPSTLLSGGEAQRIKLATYLQKKPTGKTLYILDEPTTGLHHHDIKKLLIVLNKIVSGGDTLIVIEHNLDVIKNADIIIDLGPKGGDEGGKIIAKGTPEQIAEVKNSLTAPYLKDALKKIRNK